jgi:hypothetical protein
MESVGHAAWNLDVEKVRSLISKGATVLPDQLFSVMVEKNLVGNLHDDKVIAITKMLLERVSS